MACTIGKSGAKRHRNSKPGPFTPRESVVSNFYTNLYGAIKSLNIFNSHSIVTLLEKLSQPMHGVVAGFYDFLPYRLLLTSAQHCSSLGKFPCIHIFTKESTFAQLVRTKGALGFVCTWSVCVCDSHCVFVFTTDSKYVTSSGQKGHFNLPGYIIVDNSGLIYVTGVCNNRLTTLAFFFFALCHISYNL